MEDKFFGRALTILLLKNVLPSLPERFSINDLTEATEKLSKRHVSEDDHKLLIKRLKETMLHFKRTGDISACVELTENNQPLTFYTKPKPQTDVQS